MADNKFLDSNDGEYFSERMGGGPQKVSARYRKDAGDRVNKHAQSLGLPTQYSAPPGLQEELVTWEEAAIADLNKRAAEGRDYGTGFKWTEGDTQRAKDIAKIAGETFVGISPAGIALDIRDVGTHLAAGATGAALGAAGMAAAGPIADVAKGVGRVARTALKDVDWPFVPVDPNSYRGIRRRMEWGHGSGSDREIFEMLKEEGHPEATGAFPTIRQSIADERASRLARERAIAAARQGGMTPEEAFGPDWAEWAESAYK